MISERLAHYTPYFKQHATTVVNPTIDATEAEQAIEEATEETTIAYQN